MTCRPAKKKDRQQILEITADTWDGWDYVPLLLNEWFRENGLFVAERDHEVVGVTKTTVLSPGELWLEGIRTKKELRGQGIGKALAFYQLDEALKQYPRVIRLSTAEVNVESIKLIEKMGFSLVHTFTYLEFHNPQQSEPKTGIREAKDAVSVHRIISGSTFLNESRGFIPWSWIFRESTPQLLSLYITSKQCFLYEDGGSISGILLLLPHRYDDNKIEVSLIEAPESQILDHLFAFAINAGALQGKKEIAFFSPSERLETLAKKVGFFYPYDFSKVLVYELVPS